MGDGPHCRTKDKEVVKEALKPHQEEESYLGVLYSSAPTKIAGAMKSRPDGLPED
jgi:hypothetical protein